MTISLQVKAKKEEVLAQLRKNREEHQEIVREARAGYLAKAREALSAKLDELASGKLVALQFGLVMPSDYTKEYDAAIRMLELHQESEVDLDEQLVRHLVLNEWDWMTRFIGSTASYSAKAVQYSSKL